MKSIYVTSIEPYSGKTATCLALGSKLKADSYTVGYVKPLTFQQMRTAVPQADEDAIFVNQILELDSDPKALVYHVVTPEILQERLKKPQEIELLPKLLDFCAAAAVNRDILLIEGGRSQRDGYAIGLPTPVVAHSLGSLVLLVTRFHDEVQILDEVLATQARMKDSLCGALINRVPTESRPFVTKAAVPFLEKKGVPVFGVLPDMRSLSALTVEELIKALNAEVITKYLRPQALVENLAVGAMTAEAALTRFRQYARKAVITGGDRTDIQLAALETSTTCLVLTGNLRPSPLVVKQAEDFGVPIILVRSNTLEAVEAIERVFGKTRLGETAKLKQFQDLLEEHFDYNRLYRVLGLR